MARINTNKAYEALMAQRTQRLLQEKQLELMAEMDKIQEQLGAAVKGTEEYKALLRQGRAKLREMTEAGIKVNFA